MVQLGDLRLADRLTLRIGQPGIDPIRAVAYRIDDHVRDLVITGP